MLRFAPMVYHYVTDYCLACYCVFFAHIKARAKRKDLCILSSSCFSCSRLNVALDSAKVFWSCSCKRLMSGREQIVSSVNIDINTIRGSSSRRARQHKGKQSTEVNLWKRLMWVAFPEYALSSDQASFSHLSPKHDQTWSFWTHCNIYQPLPHGLFSLWSLFLKNVFICSVIINTEILGLTWKITCLMLIVMSFFTFHQLSRRRLRSSLSVH